MGHNHKIQDTFKLWTHFCYTSWTFVELLAIQKLKFRRLTDSGLLTNSINLIHEDDTGLVIPGVVEHLSDQPGALPNVLVNYRTGDHLNTGNTFNKLTTAVQAIPALEKHFEHAHFNDHVDKDKWDALPLRNYSPADWQQLWPAVSSLCLKDKKHSVRMKRMFFHPTVQTFCHGM